MYNVATFFFCFIIIHRVISTEKSYKIYTKMYFYKSKFILVIKI